MSIQTHAAISLFGAPNTKGLVVSQDLSSRGINLLRSSPGDVKIVTIPDANQFHYGMYKSLLPYFIHSALKKTAISILNPGIVTLVEENRLLPLPLPLVAVNWSFQVASEVLDRVRSEFRGRDISSGGRPIMVVPVESRQTLVNLRELNPNSIAPCVAEAINVKSYRTLFMVNNMITALLLTHKYAAYSDREHFEKLEVAVNEENTLLDDEDDEMNCAYINEGQVAGRSIVKIDKRKFGITTIK
jgi:hypothetical protein